MGIQIFLSSRVCCSGKIAQDEDKGSYLGPCVEHNVTTAATISTSTLMKSVEFNSCKKGNKKSNSKKKAKIYAT